MMSKPAPKAPAPKPAAPEKKAGPVPAKPLTAAQKAGVDKAAGDLAKSAKAADFRSSFAAARKAGKKEFTWNGKKYNTKLKGE
jgi:hypothetical protein